LLLLSLAINCIVRLVGGTTYNKGRVEVYYNGEWGAICDNEWDDTDAGVVCRQLGYGSFGTATHSALFGRGTGPILFTNVTCNGNESRLISCSYHLANESCSHYESAGIICGMLHIHLFKI